MVEQVYPAAWRTCGTCRYWTGVQKPDVFLSRVRYDSSENAQCTFFRNNPKTIGGGNCTNWEQRFKR